MSRQPSDDASLNSDSRGDGIIGFARKSPGQPGRIITCLFNRQF